MDTNSMRSLIVRNLNDICLKEYGGTKSRMAEALGVSQSKMSRILNEDQDGIDAYLDVASRVSSEHSIPLEQLTQPKPATPEAPTGAG